MTPLILDRNFEAIGLCDEFKSFIWTDRYNKAGDFEIVTSSPIVGTEFAFQIGNYVYEKESDRLMIIEGLELKTNYNKGNDFIVTGRSLDSLLQRRIIWGQRTLKGNLQDNIEALLNENIINPSDTNRRIPDFIFERSADPKITSLTVDTQYTGENLYKAIQSLCDTNAIGFKVTRENNKFVFRLYAGTDRTYDQTENLYVEFSPRYDNLNESDYIQTSEKKRNVTLVGGEGEGNERKYFTAGESNANGLERYELFTDARGTSSKVTDDEGNQTDLSTEEYNNLLKQKGEENLAKKENQATKKLTGKMNTNQMFILNKDFFLGDIVQVVDQYHISGTSRIIEIIYSQDNKGINIYPSFDDTLVSTNQTSVYSWVDDDGQWHSIKNNNSSSSTL